MLGHVACNWAEKDVGMALLAHRGITTSERDNSVGALRAVAVAAANKTPLGIEVDVRYTLDGLIFNHDPVEQGLVLATSTAEKRLAVLGDDAPIDFRRGLRILSPLACINLEIKEPGYTEEVVDAALEHLARFSKPFDSIVISSFVPEVVAEVKTIDRRIPAGLLIDEDFDFETITVDHVLSLLRGASETPRSIYRSAPMLDTLDDVDADFLAPHWTDLSAGLLHAVTSRGKRIVSWTVNDASLLMELSLRPEVVHVITDFPALVFPELRTEEDRRAFLGPGRHEAGYPAEASALLGSRIKH